MPYFVDIHHHVIYGVDDGARTEADMQAMLKKAYDDGIRAIVTTPHVTPGVHRFDWERFDRHFEKAQHFCASEGMKLQLYRGCEILYTEATCDFLQEERIPTLAGTENVLVEFSPDTAFKVIDRAVDAILCSGYTPVIAHMERYMCLVRKPGLVKKLKDNYRLKLQVNCGTVINSKGFFLDRFVRNVFENEYVDAIGTDAHNVSSRPVQMKAAYAQLVKKWGEDYANRLTNGSVLEEG